VKRFSPIILLLALIATGCAPASNRDPGASLLGTTGYSNPDGYDYVAGGDERVEQALREPEPEAADRPAPPPNAVRAANPQKPAPAAKPLRQQLKEFEISRFRSGEAVASRFGEERVTVKFIFNGKPSVEFKAQLIGAKPKFNVNAVSAGYTLAGELNDTEQQTRGEFTLTENKTGDSARIFYWAYKARLRVRQNRERQIVAGSKFEKQLADLRDNTFGWVNNWSVVRGVSFFLVDIVKVIPQGGAPVDSLLSFKGPSLRTGEAVHNVDELSGAPSTIKLVGNGEEGAGRIFQVTMQDPETKQDNEFMLDVELETPPATNGQQPAPETPAEPVEEPEIIAPPATPAAPGQQTPPAEQEPVHAGKSYLRISQSLPRTTKMTKDFNRNRNLNGVKRWMEKYRGSWRTSLQKFYTYANPFRRVMEKVGQAFDVSPAYAYLTVIESAYFTGGHYRIEGASTSTALGPFQLLTGTAREMGLMVGGSGDERRYFVPSSCGAARYIRKLVDRFDNSDATVAILAYYQGDGGAAAAIYCSFDANAGNRQACASRINKSFSGKDYNRFLRLSKNYDYSFAEMDRMAAIPQHMRDYVDKKLAVYFISNDMTKYGFTTNGAPSGFPDNGTVMPSRALKDRECQAAVSGLL
jgi:hypothetical protein